MIDVTMTATRRPELLRDTLSSFRENLFGDRMKRGTRLIINVDPVGEDIPSESVVDVAREFFELVEYRCPTKPSFPAAFQWCWSQTTRDYIFNLEEDWRLLIPVDLDKMMELMEEFPALTTLRLSFSPCKENVKNWNHFLTWNGRFYEVPNNLKGLLGFCGHPSLIKILFVRIGLNLLDGKTNPEKQLKWRRGSPHERILQNLRYGVYGFPGMGAAVLDTGRRWKLDHGWRKVGRSGDTKDKAFFTHWERVDGQRIT